MKVARTVWRRGKGSDNIKALPIPIVMVNRYDDGHKQRQ